MTPGERNALLFLAGVGVLGAAARVLSSPATPPTRAERLALAGQLVAVDSARGAKYAPRAPRTKKSRPPSTLPSAPPEPPAIVDLDAADSAAIEALPGIGPALAQRIVLDRALRGPFGSLAALDRVKGIGPKLAARLAARVTFGGAR